MQVEAQGETARPTTMMTSGMWFSTASIMVRCCAATIATCPRGSLVSIHSAPQDIRKPQASRSAPVEQHMHGRASLMAPNAQTVPLKAGTAHLNTKLQESGSQVGQATQAGQRAAGNFARNATPPYR
jgi:hypothetical protein